MSMTSKVNPILRANILGSLKLSPKTNVQLQFSYLANPNRQFSLRAVQEATQKLVADGTLTSRKFLGKTIYSLSYCNQTNTLSTAATTTV